VLIRLARELDEGEPTPSQRALRTPGA
jgi:hypothetical protein